MFAVASRFEPHRESDALVVASKDGQLPAFL
jgi:hypothetical protein